MSSKYDRLPACGIKEKSNKRRGAARNTAEARRALSTAHTTLIAKQGVAPKLPILNELKL